ncbi:CapA family protein [Alkaliphilus crotonatoxidans]
MKQLITLIMIMSIAALLISCRMIPAPNYHQDPYGPEPVEEAPADNILPPEASDTVKIMFLGDSMMTGRVAEVINQRGIDYPLSEFMPILKDKDFIVANLETAVGTSGELMEKTFSFQTDPAMLRIFEPLKEKLVFSLANNHGMDGPLHETLAHLNSTGYNYIGIGNNEEEAFRPYILEKNDLSIAIFAASRVIPVAEWRADANRPGMATAYSFEPLISHIKAYSGQVDYVIVFLHWGEELAEEPNEDQINLEKGLREAGANIIIGCHPHVIQELKWSDKRELTAFSLGNFLFTNSRRPEANHIMALELSLSNNQIEEVKVWPGKIDFGIVRYLDKGQERHQIMDRIKRLSPTIDVLEEGIVHPMWNK